jgi:hypothetical protein
MKDRVQPNADVTQFDVIESPREPIPPYTSTLPSVVHFLNKKD